MGLLSFFKLSNPSNAPDAFERELSELELKIERHQDRLQAIKERERSTSSTVTSYSLLFWSLYSFLWYMEWGWSYWQVAWKNRRLGHHSIDIPTTTNQILEAGPVLLIPITLIFARQLCQSWYSRKHQTEQLQLRQLQKQLRDKVEELKKKTSYYTTRELLERYDDKLKTNTNPSLRRLSERPSPNSTPNTLRQRLPPSSTSSVASNPTIAASAPPSTIAPSPSRPGPNQTPQPTQSSQSPGSTGRGWADRFAEALLGGDEGNPESKYALICTKCFIHNGLVRKEELDTIQYVCPRCGGFNPSKIRRSHSPLSASSHFDRRSNPPSPPRDGIPRSASAHPTYSRPEKSGDPFGLHHRNPHIMTGIHEPREKHDVNPAHLPLPEDVSESDQERSHDHSSPIHHRRATKAAYGRQSLGVTPSSSSASLAVQPQKRSASMTLQSRSSLSPPHETAEAEDSSTSSASSSEDRPQAQKHSSKPSRRKA